MTTVKLEDGATVTYNGKESKIIKILPHRKLYIECEGVKKIVSFYDVGPFGSEEAPPVDLSAFPKEMVDKALEQFHSLDEHFEKGTTLSELARKHNVPVSTMHDRYIKRVEGGVLRFLVYPRADKGVHRQDSHIQDAVAKETSHEDRRPVTVVIGAIRDQLVKLPSADDGGPDEEVLQVSDSTLRRMIDKQRQLKKFDPRHDIPYLPSEHLMHEVHLDHTRYGLQLIDQHNYRTVSPVITHVTDGASRFGWVVVGGAGPNAVTYGRILSEVAVPRTLEHIDTPVLKAAPHILYTDHGPDLIARSIRLTAADLGIWLKLRPKNAPRYGGIVERTFLNAIISSKRLAAAAELSPREVKTLLDRHRLTLGAFTQMYQKYVYDVRNNTKHTELKCTPLEMVDLLLVGSDHRPGRGALRVIAPERREIVQINLMKAQRLKIHNNGVRPLGIPFKNAELMRREGQIVQVRFDPSLLLSHVWVWLEDEQRHLKVPRLHQRYYPPAHVSEINDVRRLLREEAYHRGEPNPDPGEEVVDERLVLRRELDRAAYEGKSTQKRGQGAAKRMARRSPFADQDDLTAPEPEPVEPGAYEEDFEPNSDVVRGTTITLTDDDT